MNRTKRNFYIDSLLVVLFFLVAATGLLVWFVVPYDTGRDELAHFIEEIHKLTSIGLVLLSIYHFITHWSWYKNALRTLRK